MTRKLETRGFEVFPGGCAGLFLWVRRRGSTGNLRVGERSQFMDNLQKLKVFVNEGENFCAEEAAWFRLTISHTMDYLEEGLNRIALATEMNRWIAFDSEKTVETCHKGEICISVSEITQMPELA